MKSTFKKFFLAATLTATALTGCGEQSTDSESCIGAKCDDVGQADLGLCVGIRGNGTSITAHFGALARIVEHYGFIDGSAGGSSGSITQFLLDAMQSSPALSECSASSCSPDAANARLALMLKTLPFHLQYIGTQTNGGAAGLQLQQAIGGLDTSSVEALLASEQAPEAADALARLLQEDLVQNLINPEIVELLATTENPEFLVRDILDAIKSFGSFSIDPEDKSLYFRPGVVSFEGLAETMDHMASFYTHLEETTGESLDAFLDHCAEPALGKTWNEAKGEFIGKSLVTCEMAFGSLLEAYWCGERDDEGACTRNPSELPIRHLDTMVGEGLSAAVSTSVLTGKAVAQWHEQFPRYLAGERVSFDIDWNDVKFGYWASPGALEGIMANEEAYEDQKTDKRLSLGQATWRTALSYSPAEPGLSRALEIDDEHISAGGWSDLHPSLVLKNMGCDKVIYITRTGDVAGFANGVANHFGMSEADFAELYDLDNPDSSYSLSIAESDAVWCTNWNDISAFEIDRVVDDAYNADMETSDAYFTEGEGAYEKTSSDLGRLGCSVGVARR